MDRRMIAKELVTMASELIAEKVVNEFPSRALKLIGDRFYDIPTKIEIGLWDKVDVKLLKRKKMIIKVPIKVSVGNYNGNITVSGIVHPNHYQIKKILPKQYKGWSVDNIEFPSFKTVEKILGIPDGGWILEDE